MLVADVTGENEINNMSFAGFDEVNSLRYSFRFGFQHYYAGDNGLMLICAVMRDANNRRYVSLRSQSSFCSRFRHIRPLYYVSSRTRLFCSFACRLMHILCKCFSRIPKKQGGPKYIRATGHWVRKAWNISQIKRLLHAKQIQNKPNTNLKQTKNKTKLCTVTRLKCSGNLNYEFSSVLFKVHRLLMPFCRKKSMNVFNIQIH